MKIEINTGPQERVFNLRAYERVLKDVAVPTSFDPEQLVVTERTWNARDDIVYISGVDDDAPGYRHAIALIEAGAVPKHWFGYWVLFMGSSKEDSVGSPPPGTFVPGIFWEGNQPKLGWRMIPRDGGHLLIKKVHWTK